VRITGQPSDLQSSAAGIEVNPAVLLSTPRFLVKLRSRAFALKCGSFCAAMECAVGIEGRV
jgi:hypothetical protein